MLSLILPFIILKYGDRVLNKTGFYRKLMIKFIFLTPVIIKHFSRLVFTDFIGFLDVASFTLSPFIKLCITMPSVFK